MKFIFLIYIGMIFTDLPLAGMIGTIGSSIMFLVSPLLFLLIIYKSKWKYRGTYISNLFLYYFLVTFYISIALFIYYSISHNTLYTPYGQLILIKLINASIYNLVYFLAYFDTVYSFTKMNLQQIHRSFLFLFLFLVVIAAIEVLNKDILNLIHLVPVDYTRARLTSAEPSRASFELVIISLLTLIAVKNKVFRIIVFATIFFISIMIASKGGLLFLFISILWVYLFNATLKQKMLFSILIIPIVFLFSYILINLVLPELLIDIDNFNSVSTRLITTVWALLSLFYFPFGEGYGTYMCYAKDMLLISTDFATQAFPFHLSRTEIDSMIQTGENVGVKSGILFQVVQNGILAVIFFYLLFHRTWKNIQLLNISEFKKKILQTALIYTVLTLLFGANMEVLYLYLLPIAYLEVMLIKQKGTIL